MPSNHNTRDDHDTATTTDNPAYGVSTRAGIATTNNSAYAIHFVNEPTQAWWQAVSSDYLSPVKFMQPNTSGPGIMKTFHSNNNYS